MNFNPIYLNFFLVLSIESLVIICLSVILLKLIKSLKRIRSNDLYVFKIHNFYLNKLYIVLYFSIFIILFNYLRIHRLSMTVDLKKFKNLFDKFDSLMPINKFTSLFLGLIFILLLGISLILLIKIQKFFIKEIKKYYLYLEFYKSSTGKASHSRFWKFLNDKGITYGYYAKTTRLVRYITILILKLNPKINREQNNIVPKIRVVLRIIPMVLPGFLFFYDCYFNDFIITKPFIYMLFFIPYIFWYNITTFIWYEVPAYNAILYEMYYCMDKMMIVNAPEIIEEKVITYVYLELYDKQSGMGSLDGGSSANEDRAYLLEHHAFYSTDGKLFTNSIGHSFIEEQNNNT